MNKAKWLIGVIAGTAAAVIAIGLLWSRPDSLARHSEQAAELFARARLCSQAASGRGPFQQIASEISREFDRAVSRYYNPYSTPITQDIANAAMLRAQAFQVRADTAFQRLNRPMSQEEQYRDLRCMTLPGDVSAWRSRHPMP